LAQLLGEGTLSSSDGLRLPTRGKSLTGRALSRYFVHEGLTSYTHISDQHCTFGTQIIVSTERDATFTLDEILGNTTELPLLEHTTDSHGQTLATFAMFDLVDKRLSPRIAKLTVESDANRLPPGRRACRARRGAPRQRRGDRPPQPRPVRDDQPLRHPDVRHPRRPRPPPQTAGRA